MYLLKHKCFSPYIILAFIKVFKKMHNKETNVVIFTWRCMSCLDI